MSDFKSDNETREIFKNSYLEMPDPKFTASAMERIGRASRRRRFLNNVLVNLSVFGLIDVIIWLGIRTTGLGVFDLVDRSLNMLNGLFNHAGQLKEAVVGNELAVYLVLSMGGIAILLSIIGLKLDRWDRVEHR